MAHGDLANSREAPELRCSASRASVCPDHPPVLPDARRGLYANNYKPSLRADPGRRRSEV